MKITPTGRIGTKEKAPMPASIVVNVTMPTLLNVSKRLGKLQEKACGSVL
jgi:hypothetical protein